MGNWSHGTYRAKGIRIHSGVGDQETNERKYEHAQITNLPHILPLLNVMKGRICIKYTKPFNV